MSLILIGTDDRHAPLSVREKLAFSKQEVLSALALLIEKGIVQGAVILSTCQRVEIYAQTVEEEPFKDLFLGFKDLFYIKKNEEAVLHLFTIAAGLDSMILGEGEILHQVKEAYGLAKNFEATTPFLNRLFERALFTGKLVRQKTGLSKSDPSMALAAVGLAESVAGELAGKNIFVIGAGVVAGGVIKHCSQRGVKSIVVANRTFIKAQELAKEFHIEAIRFEEFYLRFCEADIIFSATSSRHLILKKETVVGLAPRLNKDILLFDLALPRDIDPEIASLANIRLFNINDLKQDQLLERNEIKEAFDIVRDKASRFFEKEGISWKLKLAVGQAL